MSSGRRRFLLALIPVAAAPAAQRFSATNLPQCPTCHTQIPAGTPELVPVVAELDGTISTLPGARDLICQNCGARFVAAKG